MFYAADDRDDVVSAPHYSSSSDDEGEDYLMMDGGGDEANMGFGDYKQRIVKCGLREISEQEDAFYSQMSEEQHLDVS